MLAGRADRCVLGVNIAQPRDRIDIRIEAVATELSINRREETGSVVLALSGELDVVSAPALERHLDEALAEPHAHLTLDLGELTFVDSAGVSVLIKAKQDAEANGRTLVLARPTEQVLRVFALVGLADWLSG